MSYFRDTAYVTLPALALAFIVTGCAGDSSEPMDGEATGDAARHDGSSEPDAGVDADADAGLDAGFDADTGAGLDAGFDADTDAGFDAGVDGGVDAGADGGLDAGIDAGIDAGADGGLDAGTDASADGGLDAGIDAGPDGGLDADVDAGADGGPDAGFDAGLDAPACVPMMNDLSRRPVDIFFMVDQSTSMGADCSVGSTGTSKWCETINGLASYLRSGASVGRGAALQYFGLASGSCTTGAGYSSSESPTAGNGYLTLPSFGFDSSLNNHSPSTGSPLEGAVRGIVGFTGRAVNRRAGRITAGVLITDGSPTACDTNVANLQGHLQSHFDATGIRTFVVGLSGGTSAEYEALAVGGNGPPHGATLGGVSGLCAGAAPCRHWYAGTGGDLAATLQQIALAASACEWAFSGPVDPVSVSAEYWPNGGPPAQTLVRVPDAASCIANGWYVDDVVAPTGIILCPTVCAAVGADPNASLRITHGCP